MSTVETTLVQATHLARGAYLYIRQSTPRQVVENTESTRRQYALRDRASALGWPAERIEVIDCDLGVSGSTADRKGFQRLVSEVTMGRAGLVLGLEVSRLARTCSDWHRLVELCAVTETLILDQDGLYDPTTFNHQLILGIKGLMSALEIGILRARLRGGLLAKAARGELAVGLPVGWVYDEQGQVRLHPDAQVRRAIELLFLTFRRTGTAGATVRYFNEQGLLFPRPQRRGRDALEVLWKPLQLGTVVNILHNPRYAGAFAYGRRRTEKLPEGGTRVVSRPRKDWLALVRDAHPGYIDWEEFERNEERLRRSALAYGLHNRRSPPREGPALLQGLVLCGVCGRRMSVRYHERKQGLVPDYLCLSGRLQRREPVCQVIAGASIDQAVGGRLVEAMTPMAIELTLAVRAELQARIDEADRLRMQQVERAEYEAQLARRRYLQVDPDNRLVASSLEADWNHKLRALAEAREQAERQRTADRATFDAATEARIRGLARNFPAVWNDPATSHRDRKRMAQLLIEDVTLLQTDKLHVHLRFRGGALESLALPLPKNAWQRRLTPPDVVARVEQLAGQCEDAAIAERLNDEGLRTGAGRAFDDAAVRWVRYSHGLATPTERLRQSGKLTVSEMADRLGLSHETVRTWARDGRLRAARHGKKAVWLFEPLEEQPESIRALAAGRPRPQTAAPAPRCDPTPPALRARIGLLLLEGCTDAAVADCLNKEHWSGPTGASFDALAVRRIRMRSGLHTLSAHLRQEGKLTTREIAVRLGIGLKTAGNWARAGRLRGLRCGTGVRARWMFEPIDEQPEPIRQMAAARATLVGRAGVLSDAAAGQGAV